MATLGRLSVSRRSTLSLFSKLKRFSSIPGRYHYHSYNDKDPAPVFFNKTVQNLLKQLTGKNYDKIFRHHYFEKPTEPPSYEFMTEEMLQQSLNAAENQAERILQMPPVLKVREEIDRLISEDPVAAGFKANKVVFTDVSPNATDRDRIIVVREINGDLRLAHWEERRRMNAIYNPIPYRKVFLSKMFLSENLQNALDREEYMFLLDNACLQMDPDDPEYHRVVGTVYDHIDSKNHYEYLHSTRHYGPFCFYLTWNKCSDNLLAYLIREEKISDAVCLVNLFHTIHVDSKSLSMDNVDDMSLIRSYIENDCLKKGKVELALKSYLDLIANRNTYESNTQRMHGTEKL